jgi:hypothetical protein
MIIHKHKMKSAGCGNAPTDLLHKRGIGSIGVSVSSYRYSNG